AHRVPDGFMIELIDLEISAKLTIDSYQKVAIECGGHAARIVIGKPKILRGLDEIRPNQQRITDPQMTSDPPQERIGTGRVEVADVGPKKQRQHAVRALALLRHLAESCFI